MSVTAQLCEKIVGVTSRDIPEAAISAARQLILDGIAVAVAGARLETAPAILAGYFAEQASRPDASVIGLGLRLSPAQAALVNAASMHVLDFEPMWLPRTHALSPVLPVALALAETLSANGREVAVAVVKGIEIQGWIREASGHEESTEMRFHPPGVVGPIGAAVAAGHLLKLDPITLANAIGIATSRCGGLFSNLGTMTKSTHCGYAAALGLESAILAARGFNGSTDAFDAEQGYAYAFLPQAFEKEKLLKFGAPWRVVDPGYAIKIFPSKFTTHYGITAALALRSRIVDPDAIRAVRILGPAVPSADRPAPKTGLEGKFSVQFTVAAALLDGQVGMSTFTDERLKRPDMQTLLGKIDLTMTSDISTNYVAGRFVEVAVELKDGTILVERCTAPRGSWGAPPITENELEMKVRDCLSIALPAEAVEASITLARSLPELDGQGIGRLMDLLRGKPRALEQSAAAE